MPLILRDENDNWIKWCVDTTYVVHGYMRGHTSTTIAIVRRSVIIVLKINTRSSTESDIVRADDALPDFL